MYAPTTLYNTRWLSSLQPTKINDVTYNGVAYAQITPIKGLNIKSQLGLYATDMRSSASRAVNFPNQTSGYASEGHARSSMWTITNTIEYKFNIDDNNAFTLLAGQEGIKSQSTSFGTSGTGITDDRLANLGSVTDYNAPS